MGFRDLKKVFSITSGERNGMIFLICFILILIVLNISLPYLYPKRKTDFTRWKAEVDQYLAHLEQIKQTGSVCKMDTFDPNFPDFRKLGDFGVPYFVIKNWESYLLKGGRFKRKEQVKKIYGMSPGLFSKLETYIDISQRSFESKNMIDSFVVKASENKLNIKSVEINRADSAGLEKLPGIGPKLASRIIRFREILGGYCKVSQLREVYGFREQNIDLALPYLIMDTLNIRKLDINFTDLNALVRHPYIGFRTARRIIYARNRKGRFDTLDELKEIVGTDSLSRLIPYIEIRK